MTARPRLVVVGGGPAGLSAAAEAHALGVDVRVVDEGTTIGGQYFRARQASRQSGSPRWFTEAAATATVLSETTVVDAPSDGVLTTWHGQRRIEHLAYDWLVLATGAYDRPVALPGWTLPGVMTAGGAHTFGKLHGVTPGRRLLVAGSGPFILSVADVLSGLGSSVITLEATPFRTQLKGLRVLARDPELLRQAAGYMARLTRRGARPRYGWTVVEILGATRVEAAIIQRIDDDWRPIPGTAETVPVDGVCLGFGFVPRLDLAQLLELEIAYVSETSDYHVAVDEAMVTSDSRVLAAGEVTGVAGVRAAHIEGRLAGLTVARAAGILDVPDYRRRCTTLETQLRGLHRAAEWLRVAYRPRPALWRFATRSTVLCRCEDVTIEDAHRATQTTARDPFSIKAATRIGMGLCQGRTCSPYLIEWLRALHAYEPPSSGRPWRVRPPLTPVPLRDLVDAADPLPNKHQEPKRGPDRVTVVGDRA